MHLCLASLVLIIAEACALFIPLETVDESLVSSRGSQDALLEAAYGLVNQAEALDVLQKDRKVNITLGVMSRCSDAELCEGLFDKVLDRVGDLVNFELVYIGKIDPEEEYGVKCKHGPGECLGNIHQLCVREAYPDASVWFSTFVDCVNYSKQGDEDSARECARLAGVDWDTMVAPCVDGKLGRRLLKESVEKSQGLGIERSCSVLYNQRLICVHDDGSWDCDRHDIADFSQRARKEWSRLNQ